MRWNFQFCRVRRRLVRWRFWKAWLGSVPLWGKDWGVDELVIHGETGLLAEQTAEEFSAGINYLLDHEDDRLRMGSNALQLIHERFTFNQMMERMEAVYERAVRGPSEADVGLGTDL
ncbi:hypothetical protein CCB80_03355 [Armatimonadetes bacterium Uphvl-Ar1]|nr:hypothetical protein CCB80_03355 [Armatimonadetes bacterium Uphvl-Ar1]